MTTRMEKQKEILRWVKIVVLKTLKDKRLSHLDHDVLIAAGFYGYSQALLRYNPDKGAKFKTYAEYRIKGAVLDEVRKMIGDERRKTPKPIQVSNYNIENHLEEHDPIKETEGKIDLEVMLKKLKYSLSDKELKILQYRTEGHTLKEIAKKFRLDIGKATEVLDKIKKHACIYFQDHMEENFRITNYVCSFCKKENHKADNIRAFDCDHCGKSVKIR